MGGSPAPPPPPPLPFEYFGIHCCQHLYSNYNSKPCIPKEFRFCHFCKTIVEDEIHFIYNCPIYEDLRKKIYSIHICNSSENILKENHCKVFCKLHVCEYLYECFELRSKNRVQ